MFRKFALVSHRWLGIASAIALSIAGVTGIPLIWARPGPLRRNANRLHETLAMGPTGRWIVALFTAIAVVMLLSGLFLWWKRKLVAVRPGSGWRRILFELHHAIGVLGFAVMLLLAITGVGMAAPTSGEFRKRIVALHEATGLPLPIQVLYAVGSGAFLIQSVSGVVMWWKPWRDRARR